MKLAATCCVLTILTSVAQAADLVSQAPPNGGGTLRWSKLWIDPTPAGNNLDGDAIAYADFALSQAATINHMEWWGDAPPDLGFQIEFWKQDPGTTAYQPLGVFRDSGAKPQNTITLVPGNYTSAADPSGTTHYSLDLTTPVSLAANDATNPRWFAAIIGLTDVAYLEWNWAQGSGGSNRSYQFVRGGGPANGDLFRSLTESRAFVLSGTVVPEASTLAMMAFGAAVVALLKLRRK